MHGYDQPKRHNWEHIVLQCDSMDVQTGHNSARVDLFCMYGAKFPITVKVFGISFLT